jgi:hypothetical protein
MGQGETNWTSWMNGTRQAEEGKHNHRVTRDKSHKEPLINGQDGTRTCQFVSLQSMTQSLVYDAERNANHVPFHADPNFVFRFPHQNTRLDEAELGSSNVESINIGSEAGKGLLGAVRAVPQC